MTREVGQGTGSVSTFRKCWLSSKGQGFVSAWMVSDLLGAGVLGHSLGSLGDSMLGEFTRQQEPHRGLDLTGRDGGPLVVVSETTGLRSDALKQVVDKGVHDGHGLGGNTGVGVHLLQDLIDVDGIGLLSLVLPLLFVSFGNGLGRLTGLCSRFS